MLTMSRVPATLIAVVLACPCLAHAATFTVNSTGNSGDAAVGNGFCATAENQCTLRAAIQEANVTTALDTIRFAIGSGPQRISVPENLPTATAPVVIDGSTQPGFSGAPLIEISGSLFLDDGIRLTGGNSTLRGVVVNGFGRNGVVLAVNGGNVIEGNYIGTNAAGTAIVRNQSAGVWIESHSNRIGGLTIPQRNIISGNGGFGMEGGVVIYGAAAVGNIVQGNFIGLDVTGMSPLANLGRGVAIHGASHNLIGGQEPGAGNLIAGNRASGVRIMSGSTGNVVWRNWIGVNKLGETRVGEYPQPGTLSNARGVQIRGDGNYVLENLIAGNTEDGVLFYDGFGRDLIPLGFPRNNLVYGNYIYQNGFSGIGVFVGDRNRFVKNSIFANGHIGINLEEREFGLVTPNDADDSDTGTNGFQNFPVLQSATAVGGVTTVAGTLASRPSGMYTLEFYASPSCGLLGHGEGAYSLGQTTVTTDAAGAAAFNAVLAFAVPPGLVVTATATDPAGSTSEFSACIVVQ